MKKLRPRGQRWLKGFHYIHHHPGRNRGSSYRFNLLHLD
jgi:hypothetical protein